MIRYYTVCYLMGFLIKHVHVKETASLKKIIKTCDWLFLAWHLVAVWENCSTTTGRKNTSLGPIHFLHSQEPSDFLRTWMDGEEVERWTVVMGPGKCMMPCNASRKHPKVGDRKTYFHICSFNNTSLFSYDYFVEKIVEIK